MTQGLVATCTCAVRDFLRSKVGSRTTSLIYVVLAALVCLGLGVLGYLRREGAAIQFVRATYNTGLSFERMDWSPTSLRITGLEFNPRRDDPDPNARCAPGKLFDSLESAHVDGLTVEWGWRFLPEPTQVEFDGVTARISTQILRDETIPWLTSLPKGSVRTFAVVLRRCRPALTDFLDDTGRPLETPQFDLTIGPEVDRDSTVNLIAINRQAAEPLSLRLNYDGSGVTNLQARNWKITPARWLWVRKMLRQNTAARAWWLRDSSGQVSTAVPDWADANELSGAFNFTMSLGQSANRLSTDSLALQAEISDLDWRRRDAPDGEPQQIQLRGGVTLQAHCDQWRGGFQLDLGAGNEIRCDFDRADILPSERHKLVWEGWIERNPTLTLFRVAGTYRYLPQFERPLEKAPLILRGFDPEVRRWLTNAFACTLLEGIELRLQMKNTAELQVQLGQSDMHTYDAHITARGPKSGPASGSSAQLHMQLAEPPPAPPRAGATTAITTRPPVPVTFELHVDADRFPVPGRNDMVYTGRFRLEEGSFTRRWLSDLLLYRNLDVHPLAAIPWLDPELPRETMKVDRFEIADGRLLAFGDLKFFVRNINARASIHIDSIEPLQGWVTFHEVTGAQTGFGDHVVEFGPEKLQGSMEFSLGSLLSDGTIDPWSDRGNNLEPANLYGAYLHSTADPANVWEFKFVLPWYMTKERPGRMQVTHFPARLYPPGLKLGEGVLLDVRQPIDWQMCCWLEPAAIGEGGMAPAPLSNLPENDAAAAARLTLALARQGLPGKRLLLVQRVLKAQGIQIQTSGQFEASGLELPAVGDTKSYPYPPQ